MRKTLYILILLLTATSCHKDLLLDLPDCDYNAEILFHYNMENSTTDNYTAAYIQNIDAYIYNESGDLVTTKSFPTTGEKASLKMQLPPGKYSVVAWGNRSSLNSVNSRTQRNDMMLTHSSPYDSESHSNTSKLYHAYRTFTVRADGVTYVEPDMTHAHCQISFVVKWKGDAPTDAKDYFIQMKDVPSEYGFMPQFHISKTVGEERDPEVHDTYFNVLDVFHHVPIINTSSNLIQHRIDATMNTDKEVKATMISYRLRDDSHPLVSIHKRTATRGDIDGGSVQITKDMDLNKLFKAHFVKLDMNLKQEFKIGFEIDGDKVSAYMIEPADWEEGGSI